MINSSQCKFPDRFPDSLHNRWNHRNQRSYLCKPYRRFYYSFPYKWFCMYLCTMSYIRHCNRPHKHFYKLKYNCRNKPFCN